MPVKKEVCRNFSRGSCQFGQRCRFLHVSPQEKKANPYGFGVPNSQPSNTWTRFSPVAKQSSSDSETNHSCGDLDSCKRIILDDFHHERPLWKLTCYGHWKNAPCDIVGDISFEELRSAAYDDAKRGLSLQSIVDRERNLVTSKLLEFDKLCKPNAFPQTPQTSAPTSLSSFTQLNMAFGSRPPAPSNNATVLPNPFGLFSQTSSAFGTKIISSESQGASLIASGPSVFGSSSFTKAASNAITTSTLSTQILTSTNNLSFGPLVDLNSNSNMNGPTIREVPQPGNAGAESVWYRKRWRPGEVPEEAPPDAVCL